MAVSFRFGSRSWARLAEVDPRLQAVACSALLFSRVDFGITEGLRSEKRQRELVRTGASKTMRSAHLSGQAIDLVVIKPGGGACWDLDAYFPVAEAMQQAAKRLQVPLRWGAAWHCQDITQVQEMPPEIHAGYLADCEKGGRLPFIDAVHFELSASV